MNLVPEVKCRRCGESFSSLRSRCPNCGTRRVSQSTRSPAPTPSTVSGTEAYARASANTKWQLLFGLILVVAVILAVVVMVSTGLTGMDNANAKAVASMPVPSQATELFENAPPTPTPPPPEIETLRIMFYTNDLTDADFSMHLSEGEDGDVTLKAMAYPLTVTVDKFTWSVDNDGVVELTPNADGTECVVHQVGTIAGGVKITVEAYGVTASTRAYCTD